MRRRILTILLAVVVVAIAVPLGAALTFDRRMPRSAIVSSNALAAGSAHTAESRVPETGALVLAGGLLIGLAAAVRRT